MSSPTSNPELSLPTITRISAEIFQHLLLMQALLEQGIQDPETFLRENDVTYRVAYWGEHGIGVAISAVTPKVMKVSP